MSQHAPLESLPLFAPDVDEAPVPSEQWTELVWDGNGRSYRWRVNRRGENATPLSEYANRAPPALRFELEFMRDDGSWGPVRLGTRRDEIWAELRGSIA